MIRGTPTARRFAAMGGAYGNVPALRACLKDANRQRCDSLAFLGDAIGCCGHGDEVVDLIRGRFDILVAGNHEQEAAAGSDSCGCGYASAEDERIGCIAFERATASLSEDNRRWLGTWPDTARVMVPAGPVLLCHGSPDRTNEFLYESELDDRRLIEWLDRRGAVGFICTHTGLPWVRRLPGGRFAVNCGTVGKPDHDGDPAVHYAVVATGPDGGVEVVIRRVEYDHIAWSRTLEAEGIDPIFVEPIRTGVWTSGVASLPVWEAGQRTDRDLSRSGQLPSEQRARLLDMAARRGVCLARSAALLSLNRKHFERVPGLRLETITPAPEDSGPV